MAGIMIVQVHVIEYKVHDIQNNHAGHYQDVLKMLEKTDKNLKRLLVMPVQCRNARYVGLQGITGGLGLRVGLRGLKCGVVTGIVTLK